MAQPIYLLVMGKGHTEAWYQLSEEEQTALWAAVEEIEKRAGGSWTICCDSRWANEEIYDWGVLQYPSMEAYQQKVAELEKLNWWRYFSTTSILGTKMVW
jgi:hypothetical protein